MRVVYLICSLGMSLWAADTKPPTVPRDLRASSITSNSVTLTWTASSDFKNGSGIAGYDIFRNGAAAGTSASTSFLAGGLAASTAYQFAVRARDNAGNVSALSTPVTATTPGGACTAYPPTPAGLAVTSSSSSTISLQWNAVAPPSGCSVTYSVFRDGAQVVAGLTTTVYTASGLAPSTSYSFTVAAVTVFGSSLPSSPATGSTTAGGGTPSSWPMRVFAPYTDVTLWPTPSLTSIATQTGSKYFSLGFVVAGSGCQASWGGYYTMSQGFMASDIASLRSLGGDVIASFGGAAGSELAQACSTVSALQVQYQSVIDTYGLTRVDFDVEGAALGDSASIDRRNKAIAGLQAAAASANRTLIVQYTLPVLPSGLTSGGIALLQNAISNGVNIGKVNVMAMDYGASFDPYQMGTHAVNAMLATINQLKSLYGASRTDAQVRLMVGITPMIGLNDVVPEVFTLADASALLTAAQQNNIGMLAMWSTGRDQQCSGSPTVSPACSGVVQSPWAFTNIFKIFAGN